MKSIDSQLREAFQNSRPAQNSELKHSLYLKIEQRIIRHQKLRNIWSLFWLSLVSLTSIGALVPVVKALISDLYTSGFTEYASLLFSDGKGVLSNFRVFSMALAESLPITNVFYSLMLILIFMVSARYFISKIRNSALLTA
jgi:hypothetical protein